MQQKLIRFAKVHGYINALLMTFYGLALFPYLVHRSVWKNGAIPIGIILAIANPLLLVVGCTREDAGWVKRAMWLYIVYSIGTFFILLLETKEHLTNPMSAKLAVFIVSLHGVYVAGTLETVFNALKIHRSDAVSISFTVSEDTPTSMQPDGTFRVPEIPLLPISTRPTTTTVATDSKEPPTWT